jgi:hypothetical protein
VSIALINYCEQTAVLDEPIVIELEAGQQCLYETHITCFFGAKIGGCMMWCQTLLDARVNTILFHFEEQSQLDWDYRTYYTNLHDYAIQNPGIETAKISTNTVAIESLKEFALYALSDQYNVCYDDIKCPET